MFNICDEIASDAWSFSSSVSTSIFCFLVISENLLFVLLLIISSIVVEMAVLHHLSLCQVGAALYELCEPTFDLEMPEVRKWKRLPDWTLQFPDRLPGFTLRASAILLQLVQSLLGLDHPLCDELLLRQKLVFRPEEGLDDRRPCTGLDAAWDCSPGEEQEGDQERGRLEKNGLQHWMLVLEPAFHCFHGGSQE